MALGQDIHSADANDDQNQRKSCHRQVGNDFAGSIKIRVIRVGRKQHQKVIQPSHPGWPLFARHLQREDYASDNPDRVCCMLHYRLL